MRMAFRVFSWSGTGQQPVERAAAEAFAGSLSAGEVIRVDEDSSPESGYVAVWYWMAL